MDIFQRRHIDDQKAHEKMIREIQSKLQWGISLHWAEWPPSKNLQRINAGEGVKKREPFFTVGGNANWYSHYAEQYGSSLKN